MLNVYEILDKFKSVNPTAEIKDTFYYRNEFYTADVGGYKLVDKYLINYYLVHYLRFDPKWKAKTWYDKPMESEGFFIPVRVVEQAVKDNDYTTLVFRVGDLWMYALPKQIKLFYDKNNLIIDNGSGEPVIPIPIKMLTPDHPFEKLIQKV